MGGVVGSGIFMTPSVVAGRVHTTPLIIGAWLYGGLIALLGAFIFAELASRRPSSGGLYGYLRDAYHPVVAFMYGWTALLVSQSGGIAAAAITFGAYTAPAASGLGSPVGWGISAIALLSAVNCLGVRKGGSAQNALMLLKGIVIVALIVAGSIVMPAARHAGAAAPLTLPPATLLLAFGAAMIPVLFAYDGFQTAAFIDGELKDAKRTMPLGLVFGISAVVVLYVAVTIVGLRVLGPQGLAATTTSASDIMTRALGSTGGRIIAIGVALSTLGFMSNSILTSPRIYYAMAADGLFFKQVAWLHPRSRVPIVAIVLQAAVAIVITLSGRYDQILNYVTSIDFLFMGLAGGALFIFTRRTRAVAHAGIRVPGHPWTTGFFVAASASVVVSTFVEYPFDTLIGFGLLLLGAPVYLIWTRYARVAA